MEERHLLSTKAAVCQRAVDLHMGFRPSSRQSRLAIARLGGSCRENKNFGSRLRFDVLGNDMTSLDTIL